MGWFKRLKEGISLTTAIQNLPEAWHPQNPLPIGGESRVAWIEELKQNVEQESKNTWQLPTAGPLLSSEGKIRFTVTLITPGDFFDEESSQFPCDSRK